MKNIIFLLVFVPQLAIAQEIKPILAKVDARFGQSVANANPLDRIVVLNAEGKRVEVSDGSGRVYFRGSNQPSPTFIVKGSLGDHSVAVIDKKGTRQVTKFAVGAETSISGDAHYADMFNLFYTSMQTDTGSVVWNGKRYRFFVPWGLDHCHTMKGLKYFFDFGGEFVDLSREAQRADGMIYSFVEHMPNMDYWRTRDAKSGYTQKIGDKYFVRQPTENHPEYIFVKTVFQWWKASGDDVWMKQQLTACAKALDYSMNDPARWSQRFKLLKRVYTIDSWDFQVDDKYTPDIGITNSMIIDNDKSKFGIFFGDNTGYIMACRQLAEMYEHTGNGNQAAIFGKRADEIEQRLNELAWNGKFYTHYIDEDPTVKRDLGVDEKSQLAQSNAYTLNRGLSHEKSKAIIESYLELKRNLPFGSPGEFYAIYPPFERGFDAHGAKWQYMNGGVGGHVAGELSRGAFRHGYEAYGLDILERMYALGKQNNNKIYFSYTGSIPPPPPPANFVTIDLSKVANMDLQARKKEGSLSWMNSSREGDDFRNLPTGRQVFNGIDFNIVDPEKNNYRSVVAVSNQQGFPPKVDIAISQKTSSIYLLHTSSKPSSEGVSGSVTIQYDDGSKTVRYMIMEKHLTYWWFSRLHTERSGIAWYGSNEVSKGIGISWCSIDNPYPDKKISHISLNAAADGTIYTLFALSLADRPHYIPPKIPSFGGPDNWAAATLMAAMVEGLAGVKDSPNTEAYQKPILCPRWNETEADSIHATVCYPASKGYVAYDYIIDRDSREIKILLTGSGDEVDCHIMVPKGRKPIKVEADGKSIEFTRTVVENSMYADFRIHPLTANKLTISYD